MSSPMIIAESVSHARRRCAASTPAGSTGVVCDFDTVLRHAERSFSGQPIHVVAHSVGGFILGLAGLEPSHSPRLHDGRAIRLLARLCGRHQAADGGQVARRDAADHCLLGYFPGKKLGWLEDTPKGVVRDWTFSRQRFEDTWRGRSSARYPDKHALVQQFAAVTRRPWR